MITQLKFVGIPVSDQDRALAFYTEKLGFEISTDQPMGPGKRWIELRIARSATRVDTSGEFVPLESQDRSRWNRAQIDQAVTILDDAARHGRAAGASSFPAPTSPRCRRTRSRGSGSRSRRRAGASFRA